MNANDLNATLIERRDLDERQSIVRIRPDAGRFPEFTPGQYMILAVPAVNDAELMTELYYSIASSPETRDHLEFFVSGGEPKPDKPDLRTMEPGRRLWVDPHGHGQLTLDGVPNDANVIMVATGTGVAPFMSIVRTHHGRSRWRRLVLVHGVRQAHNLGYQEELDAICRKDAGVCYLPVLSREPDESDWSGRRGHVQDLLDDDTLARLTGVDLDPARSHVLLCGQSDMVKMVSATFQTRGHRMHEPDAPGTIHIERD